MKHLSLPVLLALISTFAAAEGQVSDEKCVDIQNGPNSCSPLLAWFGNSREYFASYAIDWAKDTLARLTNFATTGTWVSCNFICTGEANFECNNGHLGKVILYYPTNSMARSKALTSPITYWAFADSQVTTYSTTLTKTAIRSTIS